MESNKRKGKNGTFKKNVCFITDPVQRKRKEKAKLSSLMKLIEETAALTKMPIAFFALNSDSELFISGSTKGVKEFTEDGTVRKLFENCAKSDPEPEACSSKRQRIGTADEDLTNQPFFLSPDWEKLNTLEKRKLSRDLVVWDSEMGSSFKWESRFQPVWWPSDVPFESTRKSNVATLDKLINSFVKFQAFGEMEAVSEPEGDFEDWEELKEWAKEVVEENGVSLDWLKTKWEEPEDTCDKRYITLKHRSHINTDREPLECNGLAACISKCLFGVTNMYTSYIKTMAVASCVMNFNFLLEYVENGTEGIPETKIREWFCAEDASSLKDAIMNSAKVTGMLDLFGIALALKFDIDVTMEEDRFTISLTNETSNKISVMFHPSTGESCSLLKAEEFDDIVCSSNPCCQTDLSAAQFMTCLDCGLKYHQFCVAKFDSCGCSQLKLVETRIKDYMLCDDGLRRTLKRYINPKDTITGLISGKYDTYRRRTVAKILSGNTRVEVNKFFLKTLSSDSRKFAIEFTRKSLDQSTLEKLKLRFPEEAVDDIISEWLMPDIIIEVVKRIGPPPKENMTNLIVERAFFNLAHSL